MKRYLLDTNAVSDLLREHSSVARRVVAAPMAALCVSAVTEGELSFGLTKRPDATRLHLAVEQFRRRVDVLPWDTVVAKRYGIVRADMALQGKNLAPLDLLIAAHALAIDAILVTSDRAFGQVTDLHVEDWTS